MRGDFCYKWTAMILSDIDIKQAIKRKRIVIDPFDETCVQPSSYDLHLQDEVLVFANISRIPIRLYAGMKVAQICFMEMSSPVQVPYGSKKLGSKYFGQKGPTPSMGYLNFKNLKKK